jgi:hypothetical protein
MAPTADVFRLEMLITGRGRRYGGPDNYLSGEKDTL